MSDRVKAAIWLWIVATALALAGALFHIPSAHSIVDLFLLPLFWAASVITGVGSLLRQRWAQLALRFLAPILVIATAAFLIVFFVTPRGEDAGLVGLVAGVAACYFVVSLFTSIVTWRFQLFTRDT